MMVAVVVAVAAADGETVVAIIVAAEIDTAVVVMVAEIVIGTVEAVETGEVAGDVVTIDTVAEEETIDTPPMDLVVLVVAVLTVRILSPFLLRSPNLL